MRNKICHFGKVFARVNGLAFDYLNLIRKLGIEGKRVRVCKKRTIQARAIWYDEIKGRLIGPDGQEDDE